MKINNIKFILKFVLAVFLLYLFVKKINFYLVFNYLKELSPNVIIIAILINILANFISAYKWYILLPRFSYFKLLLVGMLGRFYSFVLPGQFSGELAKAYQLSHQQKETETIAASVLVDKLTGIMGLAIVSLAGIFLSSKGLPRILPVSLLILIIAGFLLLEAVKINLVRGKTYKILDLITVKVHRLEKIINYIKSIISSLSIYFNSHFIISYNILLGCLYQLSAVLIIFLFSKDLGIGLNFYEYLWIFGVISLALFLPLTIGGFGVREGTFIGLLGYMGVASEKALALSFVLLGIQILDASVGGLIELTKIYRFNYFSKAIIE